MIFSSAVPSFEGVTSDEWFSMIDRVELEIPSQAEMAAYVTARYIDTDNGTASDDDGEGINSTDTGHGSGTFRLRKFPRTDQQQIEYERQIELYNLNVKLLNTAAVELSSKPKYLVRRLVKKNSQRTVHQTQLQFRFF